MYLVMCKSEDYRPANIVGMYTSLTSAISYIDDNAQKVVDDNWGVEPCGLYCVEIAPNKGTSVFGNLTEHGKIVYSVMSSTDY